MVSAELPHPDHQRPDQPAGSDEELSSEQRHDRLDVVEEWEYDVEMREAIRLAIGLKHSLTNRGAGAESGLSSVRIHKKEELSRGS
jgi:hypothetical protein